MKATNDTPKHLEILWVADCAKCEEWGKCPFFEPPYYILDFDEYACDRYKKRDK